MPNSVYVSEAQEPNWDAAGKVHDWRNYISEEVRGFWPSFSSTVRSALYRQAAEQASIEEWD